MTLTQADILGIMSTRIASLAALKESAIEAAYEAEKAQAMLARNTMNTKVALKNTVLRYQRKRDNRLTPRQLELLALLDNNVYSRVAG